MLVYFLLIWYILQLFAIFYGRLVFFVCRYLVYFGILYEENLATLLSTGDDLLQPRTAFVPEV
jgi:hypothetical protein